MRSYPNTQFGDDRKSRDAPPNSYSPAGQCRGTDGAERNHQKEYAYAFRERRTDAASHSGAGHTHAFLQREAERIEEDKVHSLRLSRNELFSRKQRGIEGSRVGNFTHSCYMQRGIGIRIYLIGFAGLFF